MQIIGNLLFVDLVRGGSVTDVCSLSSLSRSHQLANGDAVGAIQWNGFFRPDHPLASDGPVNVVLHAFLFVQVVIVEGFNLPKTKAVNTKRIPGCYSHEGAHAAGLSIQTLQQDFWAAGNWKESFKTAKSLNIKLSKSLNILISKSPTFVGGPRGLERAGGRRRRRSDPLHRHEEVLDLDGAGGGAELADQLADLAVQLWAVTHLGGPWRKSSLYMAIRLKNLWHPQE